METVSGRHDTGCRVDPVSDTPFVGWRLDQAHVAVPVDLMLFGIDAIMRAAYKFTDRCIIHLQREATERLIVFMIGRSSSTDLSSMALEFNNELLDQQLRCRLEEQFKDV